eukprot:CAMPEP_0182442582 /NCGR_PEP_ID=MMETSP1172-20130603/1491_1 /TAXON_ID=708627 /ORGANISM="Timspurckia oligopyrenoides, Strain CCMP3278" /LENGTH=756 /DNA_ID=CAMNT_0024637521 /DNA_START=38 /DNA_END=2308 /DNA_ORIENTATION=-
MDMIDELCYELFGFGNADEILAFSKHLYAVCCVGERVSASAAQPSLICSELSRALQIVGYEKILRNHSETYFDALQVAVILSIVYFSSRIHFLNDMKSNSVSFKSIILAWIETQSNSSSFITKVLSFGTKQANQIVFHQELQQMDKNVTKDKDVYFDESKLDCTLDLTEFYNEWMYPRLELYCKTQFETSRKLNLIPNDNDDISQELQVEQHIEQEESKRLKLDVNLKPHSSSARKKSVSMLVGITDFHAAQIENETGSELFEKCGICVCLDDEITAKRRALLQDLIRKHGGTLIALDSEFSVDLYPRMESIFIIASNYSIALEIMQSTKLHDKFLEEEGISDEHDKLEQKIRFRKPEWISDCIEKGQLSSRYELLPEQFVEGSGDEIDTEESLTVRAGADEQKDYKSLIVDVFKELIEMYSVQDDDFRSRAYDKAVPIIESIVHPIRNVNDVKGCSDIGKSLMKDIEQIIDSGKTCERLEELKADERMKVLRLFMGIYDCGKKHANVWYQRGWRTLQDVREHEDELSKNQKIGLELYEEFQQRIPREEVEKIESFVRDKVRELSHGKLDALACGSYRRGSPDCGDVDILVHGEEQFTKHFLSVLVKELCECGFLTHQLSTSTAKSDAFQKCLGVCQLKDNLNTKRIHRRLDIIVVPEQEFIYALIYFTGPVGFNRSLRIRASEYGMQLSNHSLRRYTRIRSGPKSKSYEQEEFRGDPILVNSENDVFNLLKVPFKPPDQRDGRRICDEIQDRIRT